MYYIGFDLGDGESSLSYYDSENPSVLPLVIPIGQSASFPTAAAVMKETGEIIIGSNAVSEAPTVEDLRVCFKRDFKTGRADVYESYRRFISGVIRELRKIPLPFDPFNPAECRFVFGQPADWDDSVLMQYRSLLMNCGIADPLLISESRAALVYANTAKYMQMYNPASANTLVCDFGSSTLDFAYCVKGDSSNVIIFGDPRLGGGLMDEQIVLESISAIDDAGRRETVKGLFNSCGDIRSRLMLAARNLKEQFFSAGEEMPFYKSVPVYRGGINSMVIRVDRDVINTAVMYPQPLLNNNSIYRQLEEQFDKAVSVTRDDPPDIVLLTGGASRMSFFRDICRDAFQTVRPEIVYSTDPETDIANGLALDGSYSAKLEKLKEALKEYADGPSAEKIVRDKVPVLTNEISRAIVEAITADNREFPGALRGAFRKWKSTDSPQSINDMQTAVEEYIGEFCRTEEFTGLIQSSVESWSRDILDEIQTDLDRICVSLDINPAHVKFRDTSISRSLNINGREFRPGTTVMNIFDAVITAITAVIAGAVSGGAGLALVSSGPLGIIAGILAVGVLRLTVGKMAKEAATELKLHKIFRLGIPEITVFNAVSVNKMKSCVEKDMADRNVMTEEIGRMLSDYIDSVILAISCQTRV